MNNVYLFFSTLSPTTGGKKVSYHFLSHSSPFHFYASYMYGVSGWGHQFTNIKRFYRHPIFIFGPSSRSSELVSYHIVWCTWYTKKHFLKERHRHTIYNVDRVLCVWCTPHTLPVEHLYREGHTHCLQCPVCQFFFSSTKYCYKAQLVRHVFKFYKDDLWSGNLQSIQIVIWAQTLWNRIDGTVWWPTRSCELWSLWLASRTLTYFGCKSMSLTSALHCHHCCFQISKHSIWIISSMSQRYYVMLGFENYHGSGLVPAEGCYPHV